MEFLLVLVGSLLGLTGVVLYIIKLFAPKTPTPTTIVVPDFKKEVETINQTAVDKEKTTTKELNNASDQEITDRFHDAFGKPVPGAGIGTSKPTETPKG